MLARDSGGAQASADPHEQLRALEARLAAAEQALAVEQARRAYYEQILANVNDAIIVIDAVSQIQEWNAAAERIYGWATHEVLGRRLSELLLPRYLDGSTSESARVTLQEQGVWTGLVAQRHRDGHEVMIESAVRYLRDAEGQVIGLVGINRDVSARVAMEEALRHSEAQLAGIIDSAMDAIITVDAGQRIVRFNRAAEQLFGCLAVAVLGLTLDRFIPPEARVAHREHIPTFGSTGVTRRSMYSPGVLEAVRFDGTHFPIEASISQITVEGERFYTVILRDISQRKELEAQLLHAQKLESIGQLAGGVAHDFNNLLTVIGGITDLMRDGLLPEHPLQSDLAEVSLATQRATALTRQLLAFARRQLLAPRVIDLNGLIQETAPLLHRLIGENIAVSLDLLPDPLPVRADPNQIQQVLVNLAVNARDAMPNGGRLRISTRLAELAHGLEEAGGGGAISAVRIDVQDTGTGMAPEVQARIFEPFFTTKAPGHGTGLGLATSYGIVAQHNGRLEVSSQLGEGAIFTITLPAVDEALEARGSHTAAAGMPRGSETVLLVEDEAAVREFVGRVLRGLGYVVLNARHGLDALVLAERGMHFDLLLTDIVMPELSGTALAAQLKAAQPALRVVYMSGYAEHATLSEEMIAQMSLLQKPFTASALARLVRAVLDERP